MQEKRASWVRRTKRSESLWGRRAIPRYPNVGHNLKLIHSAKSAFIEAADIESAVLSKDGRHGPSIKISALLQWYLGSPGPTDQVQGAHGQADG